MGLLCNGYPRVGSHKLVELALVEGYKLHKDSARDWKKPDIADDECIHGHVFTDWDGPIWFTVRNPRNVLISISRALNQTPEFILTRESSWNAPPLFGRLWVDGYREMVSKFEITHRFEDFEAPHSATWTGKLSDWTEHWNDELETAWIKAGGLELEKEAGYGR